jgi:outer membrane protein
MKRVVAVLLVATGGLLLIAPVLSGQQTPPPPAATAGPRIAFIDIQRVLARSAAGVAAREQLERERAGMQKEIDARRQEIEKLREELDKKGALLTAEARREKEELLDRKRRDATRMADDFQRELTKKEQQLGARVLQELSGVIERFGKQRGYFMIVERRGAGVLYSAPEADLTDEIIRVYDQESAAKGGKK